MHDAVKNMLTRYNCRTQDDYINALREILQEIALLGLWRSKFFEHAAFYGGTALRILHGMNRFSEDMDFSLLSSDASFSLGSFGDALTREIRGFGFQVSFEGRKRNTDSCIDSAFLKTNTYQDLIVIEASEEILNTLHPEKRLKIKIEVDTNPPGGFVTETQYVLQPIPFSVRVYSLPDLFAGKIHAVMCRKWKNRTKGRDWYDLVWYTTHHPHIRINHLELRMRQSGDYTVEHPMDGKLLIKLMHKTIDDLDIEKARNEVAPFVRDHHELDVWSQDFFRQIITKIIAV